MVPAPPGVSAGAAAGITIAARAAHLRSARDTEPAVEGLVVAVSRITRTGPRDRHRRQPRVTSRNPRRSRRVGSVVATARCLRARLQRLVRATAEEPGTLP